MDKPLTVWYCDVCGEKIEEVKSGYVIWHSSAEMKDGMFKIIHQARCDQKSFHSSSALGDFLGANGQTVLLSFLSLGSIKKSLGQSYCKVADLDEFVDFFRRVQTPYYEEARRLFGNPSLLDDFSDSNEVGPYLGDRLRAMIENYDSTH